MLCRQVLFYYLAFFFRIFCSVRYAAPTAVDINKNSTATMSTTRLLILYEIPKKTNATVITDINIKVILSSLIIINVSDVQCRVIMFSKDTAQCVTTERYVFLLVLIVTVERDVNLYVVFAFLPFNTNAEPFEQ